MLQVIKWPKTFNLPPKFWLRCDLGEVVVEAPRRLPRCEKCRAGTMSRGEQVTSCTDCPAGYFNERNGSAECVGCDSKGYEYYQEQRGMRDCTKCPENTAIFGSNRTNKLACLCKEGTIPACFTSSALSLHDALRLSYRGLKLSANSPPSLLWLLRLGFFSRNLTYGQASLPPLCLACCRELCKHTAGTSTELPTTSPRQGPSYVPLSVARYARQACESCPRGAFCAGELAVP
jgi:hypothetical protein